MLFQFQGRTPLRASLRNLLNLLEECRVTEYGSRGTRPGFCDSSPIWAVRVLLSGGYVAFCGRVQGEFRGIRGIRAEFP